MEHGSVLKGVLLGLVWLGAVVAPSHVAWARFHSGWASFGCLVASCVVV